MKTETAPQFYRTHDVADLLGVSQCFVTKAIRDGRLASVKFGRARLIPAQAIQAYVAAATGATAVSR
jgi:excisionase family DNA binding protein